MLGAQEESTQETSTQRTFKQDNYTQKIFTQEYLKSLELKTGDIILFSAKGFYPFSILIKYITWSDWSHVGMVVEKEGQLMIFESTEGGAGQKSGVQINPADEVLYSINFKMHCSLLLHKKTRSLPLAQTGFCLQ